VADFGGGFAATIAILAALFSRQTTGMGQHIDISLLDVVLSEMIVPLASVFAGEGLSIGSKYGLTGAHPFYSVYETKDGKHLALGALEPKFWQEFCDAINRPDLEDKQYADGKDRERLFGELQALFRSRTCAEWLETFAGRDVCIEQVLTLNESLDHPQVRHRETITEMNHPGVGSIKQVKSPIRLLDTPATMRSSPPRLGEHTDDILLSLGYSRPELEELRDAGVV
jgi:crotonobetainyl-CoA:carnitine CoA-transferase CaiB-like acyl-CoA transferase